jgi:ferredoxin
MITFYFTATGNSLYVAQRIGGELRSIPRMLKEGQREFTAETIGFVFPCYGFGLPRAVSTFIQQATFHADYFFAVMTYGNMAASGLRHIEQVGRKAGVAFDYSAEILMVDNYLPFFKMEDQLASEGAKQIEAAIDRTARAIHDRHQQRIHKGALSIICSKLIHFFMSRMLDDADKQFLVNDTCNGCKVCEQVCPKHNISVAGRPTYAHHCDWCLACIHLCPQNAIHLKHERSNARFLNPHVTRHDIIVANNQRDA